MVRSATSNRRPLAPTRADIPASPDLWLHHARRGEFERAWAVSDAILRSHAGVPCWHLPRHYQYAWDGTPLEGKRVLVRCYHGLGDTIQFARYLPRVNEIAAEVTTWAPSALIPVLRTMGDVGAFLPLHDGTPDVEYDVDVESMELAHVFRTTLDTVPDSVPYLHVDPTPLPQRDGRLAVGLVWQGGDWDERRSVPFEMLAPLAEVPGIALYVLQEDAPSAGWREGFGIPVGDRSVYEFARVVRALDLLISVDTMAAHVAGALAVPVWTLLQRDADWRWMEDRDDSPWYPTMRLFRQEEPGEWGAVIARVAGELQNLNDHRQQRK